MTKEHISMSDNSIIISNQEYFYGEIKTHIEISENERNVILERFPTPKLPDSKETISLRDYKRGEFVDNMLVLIDGTEIKRTQTGKPYLDLTLSNTNGSFKAKIWAEKNSVDKEFEFFENNKCAYISGKVDEFPRDSGNKNIVIRNYLEIDSEINPLELLPTTDENMDDMVVELVYYLNQITEPHRSIALSGLRHFWDDFAVKPGAKRNHHAYLGGLLKHTLGLIRIAWHIGKRHPKTAQTMFGLLEVIQKQHRKDMAESIVNDKKQNYERLVWGGSVEHVYQTIYNFANANKNDAFDADLLISSVIWHDLGKIFDYTHVGDSNKYQHIFPSATDISSYQNSYNLNSGGFSMDELGSMVGHMPYGALMFKQTIEKENIEIDLKTIHNYMHNILSHHGKNEWGSSVRPQTATAWALHFVDYLDSRYENYDILKKAKS